MNNAIEEDFQEAIDLPPRETLLEAAAIKGSHKLGSLVIRKITAETLSYLFEVENFFIKGLKGERVSIQNANAIWSVGEFVYIHAADPDEVADCVWNKDEFKSGVRRMLSGPLNDPKTLSDALPIIEQMVAEYFAAQTQAAPVTGQPTRPQRAGKESARHGKRATSR